MVIAATLTMLILQTFHLPAGALGGFFALLFSRENLRASVYQALGLALFFLLGTTLSLVCFAMFLDSPVTHFLLVITAFYLLFFIMDTARNYGFASGFSFTMATAIPVWDGPGEVNHKVALTLYALLAVSIGAGCAIVVESVYRAFRPTIPYWPASRTACAWSAKPWVQPRTANCLHPSPERCCCSMPMWAPARFASRWCAPGKPPSSALAALR